MKTVDKATMRKWQNDQYGYVFGRNAKEWGDAMKTGAMNVVTAFQTKLPTINFFKCYKLSCAGTRNVIFLVIYCRQFFHDL